MTESAEKELDDAAKTAQSVSRGRRQLLCLVAAQLVVAAVTIGVLFFPYRSASLYTQAKDAQMLNQLADEFHQKYDRWPRRNGGVWELAVSGYLDYKTDRNRYQRLYEEFYWNKKTLRFEHKY